MKANSFLFATLFALVCLAQVNCQQPPPNVFDQFLQVVNSQQGQPLDLTSILNIFQQLVQILSSLIQLPQLGTPPSLLPPAPAPSAPAPAPQPSPPAATSAPPVPVASVPASGSAAVAAAGAAAGSSS